MAETDRRSGSPHVVIVGAGFAGLRAAKAPRKAPVRVTVIDRTNHQVAVTRYSRFAALRPAARAVG
jgi:NADH dehydrogenase FAD-containing subunit